MAVFWLAATLMTAVAVAFVLVPMLRARGERGPSAAESNLAVLRAQRREIEADVASGTLPRDARDEALAELVGRAEDDLAPAEGPAAGGERKPWIAAAAVAVLVPALAFGLYLANGMPAAADQRFTARSEGGMDDKQIIALVENLARKVRERPDDAQGWGLLARSMAALGRFQESAEAYERLAKLVPHDPQVLADYADSLGMAQGGKLTGRPYELVKEALAIDPRHRKALALAGTAAMDAADYPAAQRYWQALAGELAPGSDDALQVDAILAEIRLKAETTGQKLPAAPAKAAGKMLAAPGKTVSGSVTLAPEIAAQVSGSETLFVFARAESGSRVPLAVMRGSARQLPLAFALDDSMAMAPNARLSSAEAVRIEARISRSGDAMPRSGDLVGASAVVKPGARDVKVVVDKVVP